MESHHWARFLLELPRLEILDTSQYNDVKSYNFYSADCVPEGWMFDSSSLSSNSGKQSWSHLRQMRLYVKEILISSFLSYLNGECTQIL
jgi:Uma2 family endonuclease